MTYSKILELNYSEKVPKSKVIFVSCDRPNSSPKHGKMMKYSVYVYKTKFC